MFAKTGTITAGNSSKINDGGCALILASEQKVKELKLKPLARIVSYADYEVDPIDFCIAPQKVKFNKLGLPNRFITCLDENFSNSIPRDKRSVRSHRSRKHETIRFEPR